MNSRQLQKLGVPEGCVKSAIVAIQNAMKAGDQRASRSSRSSSRCWNARRTSPTTNTSASWPGRDRRSRVCPRGADRLSHLGRRDRPGRPRPDAQACAVPVAAAAALMPDAHVGYGLPIGGVLALEGAVIPYAVGVDIACRMKLSILDMPPATLDDKFNLYQGSARARHAFRRRLGPRNAPRPSGDGPGLERHPDHAREEGPGLEQLGHLRLGQSLRRIRRAEPAGAGTSELGLDAGQYVALLSHSGSRGPGRPSVPRTAPSPGPSFPSKYEDLAYLAWLSLDSEAGQEYWAAMNLMGDYAAANHDVIHNCVQAAGGQDHRRASRTTTTSPGRKSTAAGN